MKDIEPKDNFPYFLYEDHPDLIEAAKSMCLSPEMMEVYCYYFYMTYIAKKRITDYNFFDKHGGFTRTMSMIEDVKIKTGLRKGYTYEIGDFQYDIYDYGISNPNTSFEFCKLGTRYMFKNMSILFDLKIPNYYVDEEELEDKWIYPSAKARKNFIFTSCVERFERWNFDGGYVPLYDFPIYLNDYKKKGKCMKEFLGGIISSNDEINLPKYELLDCDEVKKCFYIEVRENPVIEYFQDYYLCLTSIGEKFIKWMEQ